MALIFALVLGLILHFGVIPREEIYLERKFGEEYVSFKRHVRPGFELIWPEVGDIKMKGFQAGDSG